MNKHVVFDCELIGTDAPVFLVCAKIIETGQTFAFWHHKKGHTAKLEKMLADKQYTWVSFNGIDFDAPLIAAAVMGYDELDLKQIANDIITNQLRSWQTYRQYKLDFLDYDHIDLIETAPGVMVSLKTYAGRMSHPSMVDMPFHHDKDLTDAECKVLEAYGKNDLSVTEALFKKLATEIELREVMGEEYGIDFRSKSDAQIAEAILKKRVGIGNSDRFVPNFVTYKAPSYIKTRSKQIKALVARFESERFSINFTNGSPIEAEWMSEPITIGKGVYKVGLGGLHSQHDKKFYIEAGPDLEVSDFDVASYYPKIMITGKIAPKLPGNKGLIFLDEYTDIFDRRMEAKHAGNKKVANTLKIVLNGTFGKLGSIYCSFYSPDLLIAVTITGQLNLLCLIYELERLRGVTVRSANTDGITVSYPPAMRESVQKVFDRNAKLTTFEYEETPYAKVAMKDVNNYIAICVDGKVKTKGLYAEAGLMKNPTMQVCSDAAVAYLGEGTDVEDFIRSCKRPEDFMAIRGVKGGGVQHKKIVEIDDWEGEPRNWSYPGMRTKPLTRVSRPPPRTIGQGGVPFGRVARWYMTQENIPPISYIESGNKVPKTEGAKICMTLPKRLPKDLDIDWYVQEALQILEDIGCPL